jgi:hypothetical protein
MKRVYMRPTLVRSRMTLQAVTAGGGSSNVVSNAD